MKIKTSELTGAALDWAVAKCEKQVPSKTTGEPFLYEHRLYLQDFIPSTDWAHGGPIIEREGINLVHQGDAHDWDASLWDYAEQDWHLHTEGPTSLIAAMRCYVASKLGDEVEVPEELC